MAVTLIGNHSRGYMGHGFSGNGAQNVPVAMGWLSVVASEVNDVAYVQLSGIVTGDINQGVHFQSEVAATVEYTLCNPAVATNTDPAVQANVMWSNLQNVAADTVVQADVGVFTVAKIKFSAPGTFYIAVR